jgi:alkylation response protein AidB-like acyl-CoA dehydrogenase
MEFRDTPDQAAFRSEVRDFISTQCPPELRGTNMMDGVSDDLRSAYNGWRKALGGKGWIAAGWPKEYGGAGLTPLEQFVFNQELAEAGAPSVGGLGVMMLGPTLIVHGNEEQKKQHLSGILSGEVNWCQGYSEPGSGSDLASLQTRAVKDGDDWVINGQKIWTSGAHQADWCFLLARSDPEAPKHRGITYFLIDMKTPGITVRPLINMEGSHGFNEVFFEDVRVPAKNVVGEVNRGWYIGTTTLDFERSSIGASVNQRQTIERNVAWMRENRASIRGGAYEGVRTAWAGRAVETQVLTMLSYRIISMQAAGQVPNSEASIAKLFNSELSQRIASTSMAMLGMAGQLRTADAPFAGEIPADYLFNVAMTIAGGTSEIQRGIIATRGLGLPRG